MQTFIDPAGITRMLNVLKQGGNEQDAKNAYFKFSPLTLVLGINNDWPNPRPILFTRLSRVYNNPDGLDELFESFGIYNQTTKTWLPPSAEQEQLSKPFSQMELGYMYLKKHLLGQGIDMADYLSVIIQINNTIRNLNEETLNVLYRRYDELYTSNDNIAAAFEYFYLDEERRPEFRPEWTNWFKTRLMLLNRYIVNTYYLKDDDMSREISREWTKALRAMEKENDLLIFTDEVNRAIDDVIQTAMDFLGHIDQTGRLRLPQISRSTLLTDVEPRWNILYNILAFGNVVSNRAVDTIPSGGKLSKRQMELIINFANLVGFWKPELPLDANELKFVRSFVMSNDPAAILGTSYVFTIGEDNVNAVIRDQILFAFKLRYFATILKNLGSGDFNAAQQTVNLYQEETLKMDRIIQKLVDMMQFRPPPPVNIDMEELQRCKDYLFKDLSNTVTKGILKDLFDPAKGCLLIVQNALKTRESDSMLIRAATDYGGYPFGSAVALGAEDIPKQNPDSNVVYFPLMGKKTTRKLKREEYVEFLKTWGHIVSYIMDPTEANMRLIQSSRVVLVNRLVTLREPVNKSIIMEIEDEEEEDLNFDELVNPIQRMYEEMQTHPVVMEYVTDKVKRDMGLQVCRQGEWIKTQGFETSVYPGETHYFPLATELSTGELVPFSKEQTLKLLSKWTALGDLLMKVVDHPENEPFPDRLAFEFKNAVHH